MPDVYNRFEDPSKVDGRSFTNADVENGRQVYICQINNKTT